MLRILVWCPVKLSYSSMQSFIDTDRLLLKFVIDRIFSSILVLGIHGLHPAALFYLSLVLSSAAFCLASATTASIQAIGISSILQ